MSTSVASSASGASSFVGALHYTLRFPDVAGHRIHVRLELPAPDPAGQRLFLPAWIPGSYLIRDFARQIEQIHAFDENGPVDVRKTSNHTWRCAPAVGTLHIEYVVYAWDLSVRSAHVDDSHAFFNGTSVFLGADGYEQTPCLVTLHQPEAHPDWQVYTSLPEASRHPTAAQRYGFGTYVAPNYDALIDHPFELGTPQTIAFDVFGVPHEMVFTGVIPNLDLERIAADTQRICEAQIRLFDPEHQRVPVLDSSDRYVFMTMVTGNDYGGLEHRSSTALMASRSDLPTLNQRDQPKTDGYLTFLGLVSHEYFHTWHVKRIKPAVFAPYRYLEPNHTELLWVFEGFTSYYDDRMLWRSGVISQAEYLKLLQRNIDAVYRAPGRHKQSVAQSSFDAWTRFYKQDENSPNALVSYYSKGALIAWALDVHLQQQSEGRASLDTVMQHLWQEFGQGFFAEGGQHGVGENAMPALIHAATAVDCADFLQRYVQGCEELPLEAIAAHDGLCLTWEATSDLPSLDVRLHSDHQGLRIATVYEHGAAHQAGLSAHDVFVAVEGLRTQSQSELDRVLSAYAPGDTVTIHVFRRDELRCYTLTLSAPPAQRSRLTIQTNTVP